ncbi:hypothetical protein [Litorilituus sediminis]|uniref:Uncharacterized protein n=1 Tax=Litorilituus sediminis TaxID=718192 RepID=A0A4P6P6E1_9GAMM|nr:hypothetical protein [Litorilituus sediminis]QBG37044.1 hypothetical protein EMK97_15590 [Litorilituus sediminis]
MQDFFFLALAPWLAFCVFAFLAKLLISFAKKRRSVAVAFGLLVQMFAPDPMVEKTIETVIEQPARKKSSTRHSDLRKTQEND